MKLKEKTYGFKDQGVRFDIGNAVEHACSDRFGEGGAVEQARATANSAVEMLGKLVALLHAKNILSDDDIVELLPGFEKSD